MSEKYCSFIVDFLDREDIAFDAFYQMFKVCTNEYSNYSQIYLDFEVVGDSQKTSSI